MAKVRKVEINNAEDQPISVQALKKLVRYYYKGEKDIYISFDKRLRSTWGCHEYKNDRHEILLSPLMCSHNRANVDYNFDHLLATWSLVKMNRHDTMCRIIQVLLHELKHAEQCDEMGPKLYTSTPDKNQEIIQCRLGYELSPYEGEAEGWSLMNFNKALEKYKAWAEQYEEYV